MSIAQLSHFSADEHGGGASATSGTRNFNSAEVLAMAGRLALAIGFVTSCSCLATAKTR